MPPDTDGYDPSDGNADGNSGYYSTSGTDSSDESGSGDTGGPADCEDPNKKCAHVFTLADDGYSHAST